MRIQVPKRHQQCSVEHYLVHECKLTPRSKLKAAFQKKQVFVNKKPVSRAHLLSGGELIEIKSESVFYRELLTINPNPARKLQIVLETKDFIVINKPAGFHSHPQKPNETNTVLNYLAAQFPSAANTFRPDKPLEGGLIHRLDQGTSGCLICAVNQNSFNEFKQWLSQGQLKKIYLAWLEGNLNFSGSFEFFLGHDPKNKKKMKVFLKNPSRERVWKAKTAVFPICFSESENCSLAFVKIQTGVMHQIRACLAAIGHPVLGDGLYRKPKTPLRPKISFLTKSEKEEYNRLFSNVVWKSKKKNHVLRPRFYKLPKNSFFLHAFWIKCERQPKLKAGCTAPLPNYFL